MNRLAIAIVVAGTLAPAIVWGQVGEVRQCLDNNQVKAAHTLWEPESEEAASRSRGKKGKDSCRFARDGECDEPDLCDPGTDTSDCSDEGGYEGDYEDEEEGEGEDIDEGEEEGNDRRDNRPLHCCDGYGRPWCQIVVNPGPIGSPCWCSGVPGTGTICR